MSKKIFRLCMPKNLIKKLGERVMLTGKAKKKTSISPSEYGSYILQNKKKGRRND